jgi:hypothetical protein
MNFQYKSLDWKSFESYLSTTAQNLLTDDAFTDVTLVSEDHKTFKAHKVMLSACSSVFKSLLMINASQLVQQTTLYLRGVNSEKLEALIEFIYTGKTSILQANVEEFLVIANDLKILGLYSDFMFQETLNTDNSDDSLNKSGEQILVENDDKFNIMKINLPELKTNEEISTFACDQCPYTSKERYMVKKHEMSVHGEAKFACELCTYRTTRKDSFKLHVLKHQLTQNQDIHFCKDCTFKSSSLRDFQSHTRDNHRGSKYSCEECSYKANRKSHLKIHIEGQHLGLQFVCDQCEFSTKSSASLHRHQKSMHGNEKYTCDKCAFQSSHSAACKNHMILMHLNDKHASGNIIEK